MTHKIMMIEINKRGGRDVVTTQQLLGISIEHWKGLRDLAKAGTPIRGKLVPCSDNCALCYRYKKEGGGCSELAYGTCILGENGCGSLWVAAVDKLNTLGFIAAADEMIAFLESFKENDDMLVMRTEPAIKDAIGLCDQSMPYGVLKVALPGKPSKDLLAKALHHFNACEKATARLKERKAEMDRAKKHTPLGFTFDEEKLTDEILEIIDGKPLLKVGDEIEAGKVPIGAKVEIENILGSKIKVEVKSTDGISVCFDCVACGPEGNRYIADNTKCTILELPPEKSK